MQDGACADISCPPGLRLIVLKRQALDAFCLAVERTDVLQALHAHASDFKRDAAGPAWHVDAGAAIPAWHSCAAPIDEPVWLRVIDAHVFVRMKRPPAFAVFIFADAPYSVKGMRLPHPKSQSSFPWNIS